MDYRELLRMYKNGELTEEQKRKVRNDIEKHDAISEYLFENDVTFIDFDMNDPSHPSNGHKKAFKTDEDTSGEKFVKSIRKTIRCHFIKLGIIILSIVIIVMLLQNFVFPGFVNRFFYDPMEQIDTKEKTWSHNRINVDMAVYSDIFLPTKRFDQTNVSSNGYGDYDLTISQAAYLINGIRLTANANIKRNILTIYESQVLDRPPNNMFEMYDNKKEADEQLDETLKSNNEYYRVFIAFNNDIKYKKAYNFIKKYDMWFPWVAINTNNGSITGMGIEPTGTVFNDISDPKIIRNYDCLFLENEEYSNENKAAAHFLSSIKYLKDQGIFSDMMGYSEKTGSGELSKEYLKITKENIENNGLKCYGIACLAKPEDIEKMNKEKDVKMIKATEINIGY